MTAASQDPAPAPVYRGMTQAELDAQYDLRTAAPDHEVWAARRTNWSERARAGLACSLGVRYGTTDRQAMDIFPAAEGTVPAGGLAPVEVYIHGGAWRAKSKEDVSFIAEALVPAGVMFVAIDHDLLPAVTLDQIVAQVRAAVAWIHRNIAGFGGDPDRLHISGHSSGAHLAAMVLATDWASLGLPADTIKAACLTSGLFDLEPVRLSERNGKMDLDGVAVARLSPVHNLPARPMPLVMSVGGRETAEFLRQTAAYRAAWEAAGLGRVRFVEMPSDHHYSLAVEPGNAASPLFRAVLDDIRAMGGKPNVSSHASGGSAAGASGPAARHPHIEGKLNWERAGKAGPPMVFVHPNPTDHDVWTYQQAHFSSWTRAISIDLPGYGRSPHCTPGVTMSEIADACWEAVDAIAAPDEPVILVGCSVGYAVVLHMAAQQPGRTSCILLSGCSYRPEGKPFAFKRIEQYGEVGVSNRRQHFAEIVSPAFLASPLGEYFRELFLERNDTADATSIIEMFRALGQPDPEEIFDTGHPTLIITGSLDNSHQSAFKLQARIAGAELVTIQDAGHACNLEQPWLWDRIALEFLRRRGFLPG